ncbi:MAG: phosphate/phosphite/phosphonate ABC transporter substrate-binding protein [Geminicoccaceae bacterium]|nr:phosphate/phosphite/phosphonate ABC transporter substrate-binding protein [Geminicoccaceae bacterium]
MTNRVDRRFLLRLTLAVSAAGFAAWPAWALDSRYRDADGDLVADPPNDPARWVDPQVLVFTYSPAEDPSLYARIFADLVDHLARRTGRKVQFLQVRSNAAMVEAMRAGRLHVAGFGPGATPLAVNCAGFVPVAMMAAKDGSFGYRMEIVSHPGSGIEKVEDLRGKKLAFTTETSNSGYKAPSVILHDRFGLVAGRDFEPVFSGKHDNSILGVARRDYPAAAIADTIRLRMIARGMVRAEDLVVIFRSEPFPTSAFGHAHDLHPELTRQIREALFDFPWEGTELAREFAKHEPPLERFIPIRYDETYAIVRDIDKAMGVTYNC